MSVEGRHQSMNEFVDGSHEDGSMKIMICTDLAARGLDFGGGSAENSKVDHVINFDFPMNPIDYIHRSGRTVGLGASWNLVDPVQSRIQLTLYRVESSWTLSLIAPGFSP
jgi:superfamily II DNA/RNA helicase